MLNKHSTSQVFHHDNCKFIAGAQCVESFPQASAMEFAFIGRSNVGKSSLINALFKSHKLARTSKNPGCTKQINFFAIGGGMFRIVDLPGYGYAFASKSTISHWQNMMWHYLTMRSTLRKVWVLIDARRGMMGSDEELMRAMSGGGIAFHVILSKIDQLTTDQVRVVLAKMTQTYEIYPSMYNGIICCSSTKNIGIADIRHHIMSHILQ